MAMQPFSIECHSQFKSINFTDSPSLSDMITSVDERVPTTTFGTGVGSDDGNIEL